jgi:hypothetical protein
MQADDVAVHSVVQEARLMGTTGLSLQGARLISLHLKIIGLRGTFMELLQRWSSELVAFSVALRSSATAESGGVKAALTSAGYMVLPALTARCAAHWRGGGLHVLRCCAARGMRSRLVLRCA